MKKIRIIPRMDIKSPNVVKGIHLEGIRAVGDPASLSLKYYEEGADELIYIDVVASLYGRNYAAEVIEQVSNEIFIPLTVGGGIRTVDDISSILKCGADKVAINTGFIKNPDFVNQAAEQFGSQCIVGCLEVKRQKAGNWQAFYNSGREVSRKDAVEWSLELVERGVGELMITSIDQDGTCEGFDLEVTARIASLVSVPVIASGGAGKVEHIRSAIENGFADAVAIAHLFHYEKSSIKNVKAKLFGT